MRAIRAGILIGGHSRRMGRDKALLEVGGRPLLERTLDVLHALPARTFEGVALIGDPPFALHGPAQVERVPDRHGLGGPLAGLLGAFDADPRAAWLVVACDLPLLEPNAIAWLLAQRGQGIVAVVPRLDAARDRIEPLLALYEPEARPLLERLAAEAEPHERSLQRLSRLPGVLTPVPPAADLHPSWTNVNTPAELRGLTRLG